LGGPVPDHTGGRSRAHLRVGQRDGLTATYHSFEAQTGGLDYGDEIDLLASCTVIENVVLYAKYASYSADELPTAGTPAQPFDTEKVWVYAEYKF
jgi:hypothetical protein